MSSIYDSLTNIQNNTNQVNYNRGRANLGNDKLGKDAFMQLMMAQLQYQDPTEPMDNSQFLQQQAMYAQTETVQDLNKTLTLTSQINQATSLVGKYVEVGYTEEGQSDPSFKTGKVDSIIISNGQVGLRVGDLVYGVGQVTKVFDGVPPADTSNASMSLPDQMVAANKLRGKYVQFEYQLPGATGKTTFSGMVDDVVNNAKDVSLKLGDQVFNYAEIYNVQSSDSPFPST